MTENTYDELTNYSDRYNLKEHEDPESWNFYKQQRAQQWDPDEILLYEDKDEFDGLNLRLKRLIFYILAFFAPADGLVCDQIHQLVSEIRNFSQRCFLYEQISDEITHARSYKDSVMTFFDKKDQIEIFKAMDKLPCIKEKGDFVTSYMNNKDLPLSLRFVAAAVSEGVFFVSLFAIIFYVRQKKILNRFCFLNEQVCKDEKLHRDFDVMMASRGFKQGEFTEEQAIDIIHYGINVEMEHIKFMLDEPIDSKETDEIGGLTISNMQRFISTLADQIVTGIGIPRHFTYPEGGSPSWGGQVEEYSPPWMDALSMTRKTNFYEATVGSYTRTSQKKMGNGDVNASLTDPLSLGI